MRAAAQTVVAAHSPGAAQPCVLGHIHLQAAAKGVQLQPRMPCEAGRSSDLRSSRGLLGCRSTML